jgi:hypothetical protein
MDRVGIRRQIPFTVTSIHSVQRCGGTESLNRLMRTSFVGNILQLLAKFSSEDERPLAN